MRRDLFLVSILIAVIALMFTNEIIKIDYNLNLMDYMVLSQDYSEEEKATLSEYGTLIYGGNMTEPPLGKYYEDTGQYLGLVTDFIYALAIELETDIVMRPMVWNDALEALAAGEIDLCDLTPSEERAKFYLFSDQIYDLNGVALIPSEHVGIQSLNDLDGIKVGVQAGDYVIESLYRRNIYPDFRYTDNLTSAMQLLYEGAVEAVVGDEPVIKNHISDARVINDYELLNEKIYESYVVVGVPKTHGDLMPVLNKAIFRMRKAGVLDKIQGKWLGTDTVADEKRMNEKMQRSVMALFALFGIFIYMVYAWNRNLKKLVEEKTTDLRAVTEELEIILDNIKSTIILADSGGTIRKIKGSIPGGESVCRFSGNCRMQDVDFLNILLDDQSVRSMFESGETGRTVSVDIKYKMKVYECHSVLIDSVHPLVLIIINDETTERIQKKQILHSNKMEAVGRLAAGIAHELRNPLGVVRNSTFILKDNPMLDHDDLTAIDSIDRSVERAGRIIENLLNYSRLDETQDRLVNVREVLVETINYFKKSPENRSIAFTLTGRPDIVIDSNEESIRHIVTNLIGNGIEAIDAGGSIDVAVERDEDRVNIHVRDSGCGMNETEIDRIFDPFYTTKPTGKGTGLGLYIVHSQVQKLGGTVDVASVPGEGSVFTVSIPAERWTDA